MDSVKCSKPDLTNYTALAPFQKSKIDELQKTPPQQMRNKQQKLTFFNCCWVYNTWSHCRIVANSVNWTALMALTLWPHFSGNKTHTQALNVTCNLESFSFMKPCGYFMILVYQHLGRLWGSQRDEELVFFVCWILCEFTKILRGVQTVSWQRTRRVQLQGWRRRWWELKINYMQNLIDKSTQTKTWHNKPLIIQPK